MSDLIGWVVQVASVRAGDGVLVVEHWYANIADKQKATETVRRVAGAKLDTSVNAVSPLSKDIFPELGIGKGSVSQARRRTVSKVTSSPPAPGPPMWITED